MAFGADVVALDHVAGRAAAGDVHAVAGVAADDVAGAGRRAADGVVDRPREDADPASGVAELAVPSAPMPM